MKAHPPRHQPPRHRDAFALGGWLFADLLLALAVFFLAASPAGSSPTPTPAPTPTPTPEYSPYRTPSMSPSPTASPTPRPTPCRNTVQLRKNLVTVPAIRPGLMATDAAIRRAFSKWKDQRIGLLLTFGHGATPGAGVTMAERVNALVKRSFPNAITKQTITESYFNSHGSVGEVQFVAYLIANTCSP